MAVPLWHQPPIPQTIWWIEGHAMYAARYSTVSKSDPAWQLVAPGQAGRAWLAAAGLYSARLQTRAQALRAFDAAAALNAPPAAQYPHPTPIRKGHAIWGDWTIRTINGIHRIEGPLMETTWSRTSNWRDAMLHILHQDIIRRG